MKNRYGFTAYIIMAVLIFVTAVALIFAAINIKENKEALASKDEEIAEYIDYSVELRREAYSLSKSSEEEMTYLNDYIENIDKYDNARTKVNISLAMLTDTADMLGNKYVQGIVTETSYRDIQNKFTIANSKLESLVKSE